MKVLSAEQCLYRIERIANQIDVEAVTRPCRPDRWESWDAWNRNICNTISESLRADVSTRLSTRAQEGKYIVSTRRAQGVAIRNQGTLTRSLGNSRISLHFKLVPESGSSP